MANQKFKKELNSLGAKAKEAKEFLLNLFLLDFLLI